MQLNSRVLIVAAILCAAFLFNSHELLAGSSKVKVKGSVEEVTEQVEGAFKELEIYQSNASLEKDWSQAIGKARDGSKVTVSVSMMSKDECEVSVSSEAPGDPEIEQRFLRLMQSR